MRICHLIYDDVANPWLGGGGAIRAREIYRRLADRHDITLVTGDFPGSKRQEEAEGIHVVRVGSGRSYSMSRLSYTLTAPAQLRRLRWDVFVHEFSAFAPLRIPRPGQASVACPRAGAGAVVLAAGRAYGPPGHRATGPLEEHPEAEDGVQIVRFRFRDQAPAGAPTEVELP